MSKLVRLTVLLALIGVLAIASSAQAQPVQQVRIPVGDLWFCDDSFQGGVCETTINAGDSISWDFGGASLPHTTTECGASCDDPTDAPAWDSGTITNGSTFQFTFSEPGTYLYRCSIHPALMRGRIIVEERADPDPGEPTDGEPPSKAEPIDLPDGEPEPAPVDDEALPEELPSTGLARQQSSSWDEWALATLFVLGATFVAAGALAYRRTR